MPPFDMSTRDCIANIPFRLGHTRVLEFVKNIETDWLNFGAK